MSDHYSKISVECASLDQVRNTVSEVIGEHFFGTTRPPLNMIIEVIDYTEEFEFSRNSLEELGLEETDEIIRNLNLKNFNVLVEINCSHASFADRILRPFTDAIAEEISKKLHTRALVQFPNKETPFSMFEDGMREELYFDQNDDYFKNQFWVPKKQ